MTKFMGFQGPTFTMEVPTNWIITSTPKLQAIFVAPNDKNNLPVQPNFIVSIRKLKEDTTVQTVAESTKTTQQKEYPDYEILNEKDISKDAVSGMYRLYKWHKADESVGVFQHQAFYLASQVLYTLTATRPDMDNLENVDEIFIKMVQSFDVTN